MIVMKFGGTSVEDAKSIQTVIKIVQKEQSRRPVVVLSAIAGATNTLLKAARTAQEGNLNEAVKLLNDLLDRHVTVMENLIDNRATVQRLIASFKPHFEELRNLCHGIAILGELTNRSLDAIASMGELLSSQILCEAMCSQGISAKWIDARTFIKTDDQFACAAPLFDEINTKAKEILSPILESKTIVITQGFIGSNSKGITTTLGRGGSDYSASIIGAALDAEEIQIWTDVDGVLTSDPRIAPTAQKLRIISFREAAELAYFGAKVLHPSTIFPAVKKDIPVVVLNSKRPENKGTRIVSRPPKTNIPVKSIACKRGITVVNVQSLRMLMAYGFLESIFSVFNKYETSVDLVSTSEVAVSLTIDNTSKLDKIIEELSTFAEVSVLEKQGIICIVGDQMRSTAGVANQIFHALREINLVMISQGASEINMSIVIDESQIDQAVKNLHKHFFETDLDSNMFEPVGGK
ncbi:MAG: lysine-sensitive aspartokinase 3 [Bacteroidetes bacterium]|nr:lysine-sensitive aspartokinase 3 [Bacteroidota bacterium]